MNLATTDSQSDALENALELASWNRPRSAEELRSFVESHHAALPDLIELV